MRRLLLAMVLGAVLLVPSSSFGAQTTSNLSGVITRITGGIKVVIKNNGPDKATYAWVRLANGVKHTGCSADRGSCGPGGDESTVKFGWGFPTYFPAGEERAVTIMTDVAYPAGAGAELFTSDFQNDPPIPAGRATGSPALSEPCKCTSLTARILPGSLSLRDVVSLKRACKGQAKNAPIALSVAFKSNGNIDLKKSNLR